MNVRIVITDSGLGGLSVLAELERRLRENPIFESTELIFFNSLYSSSYGYNSMMDLSEKAIVFNNALNSIEENYKPDIILVACNTLSIVYPHTNYAQNPKTEVRGLRIKLFASFPATLITLYSFLSFIQTYLINILVYIPG